MSNTTQQAGLSQAGGTDQAGALPSLEAWRSLAPDCYQMCSELSALAWGKRANYGSASPSLVEAIQRDCCRLVAPRKRLSQYQPSRHPPRTADVTMVMMKRLRPAGRRRWHGNLSYKCAGYKTVPAGRELAWTLR
ncbi:hypothetical protein Bbelb_071470 [Branchiostoma belcheri]|nr:hypothetical protein Bbelb_071470 [Branchiostoma belcheri]